MTQPGGSGDPKFDTSPRGNPPPPGYPPPPPGGYPPPPPGGYPPPGHYPPPPPGGYPPPPPGGYPPPYSYGPQYGYRAYPAPGATNGFAIASLVCSCIGIGLLGIIFGHVARRQIRVQGQGGDGMAIAGIVLGWVGLVISVIAIIGVLSVMNSVSTPPFPQG